MHSPRENCPSANRVTVLILAAGSGLRMNSRPKALLSCAGRTLLEHVVARFQPLAGEILVGLRDADLAEGVQRLAGTDARVIAGGATRQETIQRLAVCATRDLIVVHDVARPLVTAQQVMSILAEADRHGAAIPCLPATRRNCLGRSENGFLVESLDRDAVVLTQAPFACRRPWLDEVFKLADKDGLADTGISGLFVQAGFPVRLIPGDPENVKVTYPEDWPPIRAKLRKQLRARVQEGLISNA